VAQHGDLLLVPGLDVYRNLPQKTLRMLQYALGTGACSYTHVMKVRRGQPSRPSCCAC
jgi:hypothetical protein